MTGTTIAQAIPIAISPILTRIYTPEDFGVFALFIAISAIFSSIVNGRYELAIMLPKKDEDAINIFALSFIITASVSLMLLILVVLFNDYFTSLLGNDEISVWLYFVPVAVFFTGMFNILNYFNNRRKNYKDLRNATILKSIVSATVQLSVGFVKQGATGLISGQMLSQAFANTRLLKNIIQNKILISKISKVKVLTLAKKYKDFPKHSMPTALLDVVSMNAPVYILGKFFSIQILGYYSFAYRILQMPSGLIAGAFSQVFYQKFNELSGNSIEQIRFILHIWKKLFLIGFIPFGIIFLFGEEIFAFVFGQNWAEAGKIASYLSIMIFFMFVSSPTSSAYIVLKMQKIGLYFGIVVLIYRPLALLYGYLVNDFWLGLKIMILLELVQIFFYNIIILFKLKEKR